MAKSIKRISLAIFFLAFAIMNIYAAQDSIPGVRKIKDVLIYKDTAFYSTFPSVVRRPDGELLVAFRRAPNRMIFGEKGNNHVDDNSYLEMVRSKDAEH